MADLFDRTERITRAEMLDAKLRQQNPIEAIEQALQEMQQGLVQLRLSVTSMSNAYAQTKRKLNYAQAEVKKWERRVQLASKKGIDNLAKVALEHKKSELVAIAKLSAKLKQQAEAMADLQHQQIDCKTKVAEAHNKMISLIERAQKATNSQQITVGGLDTSRIMEAFENLERIVQQWEVRSQIADELQGADLETCLVMLESERKVNDELTSIKAQLLSDLSQGQADFPETAEEKSVGKPKDEVDAELEALKTKLDQL